MVFLAKTNAAQTLAEKAFPTFLIAIICLVALSDVGILNHDQGHTQLCSAQNFAVSEHCPHLDWTRPSKSPLCQVLAPLASH